MRDGNPGKLQLGIDEATGVVTVKFETNLDLKQVADQPIEIVAEVLANRLERASIDLLVGMRERAQ